MENKEMNMIIKIIGLIGVIFVLIAQFVPWGAGAYLFGADFGAFGDWDIFYIRVMGLGIWQLTLIGVIMIVLFFLNLVLLLTGFLTFKNIATKGTTKYLKLGIFATVEFILYIVGISIASGGMAGFGAYGIGFVMILLAMVMFYVTFGLGKVFGITAAPAMYQQPMYQQTPTQQPQMMHTSQQPPPTQQPTPPPQQQPPQPAQTPPPAKTEATPNFCPECGSQLEANTKFCPGCGYKL